MIHPKVAAAHLERRAAIYVRQSTPGQVATNAESRRRQYALVERAAELGWAREQVMVIDDDLGVSGAGTTRAGFERLVAEVGLGRIGIVLGLEASRLARNNRDWYRLLDLCGVVDTLIADADGVYHPGQFNDRLLLGLKGTMSEAELHLIRSRLAGGLWEKARRGELVVHLPVGYDHDATGRIVLTPDEAVRATIRLVFAKFAELGSARQVAAHLREVGVPLPHRRCGQAEVSWQPATFAPSTGSSPTRSTPASTPTGAPRLSGASTTAGGSPPVSVPAPPATGRSASPTTTRASSPRRSGAPTCSGSARTGGRRRARRRCGPGGRGAAAGAAALRPLRPQAPGRLRRHRRHRAPLRLSSGPPLAGR